MCSIRLYFVSAVLLLLGAGLRGSDKGVIALLSLERGLEQISLKKNTMRYAEYIPMIAQRHFEDFQREKKEFAQKGLKLPLAGTNKTRAQYMLQQTEGLIIQLANVLENSDAQEDAEKNHALMRHLLQMREELISLDLEGVGLGFCKKCGVEFEAIDLGAKFCRTCAEPRT